MKQQIEVDLCASAVKRWGYEQAFAADIIMKFDRNEWQDVENSLLSGFNASPANKVTYELARFEKQSYYITFHDSTVYIGLAVRPYHGDTLPAGQERKP